MIRIVGDDDMEFSESFGKDDVKANKRYKQIKEIIEAK